MNKLRIFQFKTKFGELLLGDFENKLCLCDWIHRKMREQIDRRIQSYFNASYEKGETKIIESAISQLLEYFEKKRKIFDIPLIFAGTDFQKKVWRELINIPYGETRTYAELAVKTGNIKSIRAVASANGANALSIFVPCHRIIGSNGKLIGYAGGLQTKKKLLLLEKSPAPSENGLF